MKPGTAFSTVLRPGSPSVLGDEIESMRDTRWTRNTLLWILSAGAFGFVVYALGAAQSFGNFAILASLGVLVGGAAFLLGNLVGFLFGIPKTAQGDPTANGNNGAIGTAANGATYQVNTNLEQISDWLTKIIVGLGLIELKSLPGLMDRLGNFLQTNLPPGITITKTPLLALVTFFAIDGFLAGYLLTRLYLAGAFKRADGISDLARKARLDLQEAEKEQPISNKLDIEGVPAPTVRPSVERLLSRIESEKLRPDQLTAEDAEVVGTAYYHREEYGRAIPFLERVVAAQPENLGSILKLAVALGEADRRGDAVAILEKLARQPKAPQVTTKLLGYYLLWFPERLGESLRLSEEYLRAVPDDSGAWFNTAAANAQLHGKAQSTPETDQEEVKGLRAKALEALSRAIDLDFHWKRRAATLEDFESLAQDPDFQALITEAR